MPVLIFLLDLEFPAIHIVPFTIGTEYRGGIYFQTVFLSILPRALDEEIQGIRRIREEIEVNGFPKRIHFLIQIKMIFRQSRYRFAKRNSDRISQVARTGSVYGQSPQRAGIRLILYCLLRLRHRPATHGKLYRIGLRTKYIHGIAFQVTHLHL